jgi:hypothetical protein
MDERGVVETFDQSLCGLLYHDHVPDLSKCRQDQRILDYLRCQEAVIHDEIEFFGRSVYQDTACEVSGRHAVTDVHFSELYDMAHAINFIACDCIHPRFRVIFQVYCIIPFVIARGKTGDYWIITNVVNHGLIVLRKFCASIQ